MEGEKVMRGEKRGDKGRGKKERGKGDTIAVNIHCNKPGIKLII